ncbi:MAG: TOBE domain-containing protein, partial [archaeon]
GEANFLKAKLGKNGDRSSLIVDEVILQTTETSYHEGQAVVAAIRPEFIDIGREKSDGENVLECKVENATFMGSVIRYDTRISRNLVVTVKYPVCYSDLDLSPGDTAFLHIPSDRILVYPTPEHGLEREIQLE